MSKPRQTFTDPETGEEIESTGLARWGAGVAFGAVLGLVLGLIFGLWGGRIGLLINGMIFGLIGALVYHITLQHLRGPRKFRRGHSERSATLRWSF